MCPISHMKYTQYFIMMHICYYYPIKLLYFSARWVKVASFVDPFLLVTQEMDQNVYLALLTAMDILSFVLASP